MNIRTLILLFFTAFSLFSCESIRLSRLNQKPAKFEVRANKVYVNGTLGQKAYKNARSKLDKNPQVKFMVLENIEGSVNQYYTRLLCDYVKEKSIQTIAPVKSQIYGGGTDLLFSGLNPIVSDSSYVGVTGEVAGGKVLNSNNKTDDVHSDHLKFYDSIEINKDYYWYRIDKAGEDEIYWMPYTDISKMNLASVMPQEKVTSFLNEKVGNVLLVALKSYKVRYKILKDHGEIKNAEELKTSTIKRNEEIRHAFDSLYTATPFYYFSMDNLDQIMNGNYDSVFNAKNEIGVLKKDGNTMYFIGDVSSTDNLNLPSLNLRFDNFEPTNKYERTLESVKVMTPNFDAIVKRFNKEVESFIVKIQGI